MGFNIDITRPIEFDFAEQVGHATYRLNVLNQEFMDWRQAEREAGRDPFFEMLEKLVVSWDLERNGEPVPITREAMKTVNIDLLVTIWNKIWADAGEASGAR